MTVESKLRILIDITLLHIYVITQLFFLCHKILFYQYECTQGNSRYYPTFGFIIVSAILTQTTKSDFCSKMEQIFNCFLNMKNTSFDILFCIQYEYMMIEIYKLSLKSNFNVYMRFIYIYGRTLIAFKSKWDRQRNILS